MKKRCTNSACRRVFSLNAEKEEKSVSCPYCGKQYPRVEPANNGCWDVVLNVPDHNGLKVKMIKSIRILTGLGLRKSKEILDAGKPLVLGTFKKAVPAKQFAAAENARLLEQATDPFLVKAIRRR